LILALPQVFIPLLINEKKKGLNLQNKYTCSVFLESQTVSKRSEQNPIMNEEIFQNLSIFKIVFDKPKKEIARFEVTNCQQRGGTKRPKRFHSKIFPRGCNVPLLAQLRIFEPIPFVRQTWK